MWFGGICFQPHAAVDQLLIYFMELSTNISDCPYIYHASDNLRHNQAGVKCHHPNLISCLGSNLQRKNDISCRQRLTLTLVLAALSEKVDMMVWLNTVGQLSCIYKGRWLGKTNLIRVLFLKIPVSDDAEFFKWNNLTLKWAHLPMTLRLATSQDWLKDLQTVPEIWIFV